MSGAERRKHKRFQLSHAKVRCFSFDTQHVYALKNFSDGGLCLQEGVHIPEGTLVSIESTEPKLSSTRIQGRVIRSTFQLGIEFVSPKQDTQSWLKECEFID